MKLKIKDDTFKGECYQQYNGMTVAIEIDKETDAPMVGRSGKTKAYKTPSGGRLYLSDDQVTSV